MLGVYRRLNRGAKPWENTLVFARERNARDFQIKRKQGKLSWHLIRQLFLRNHNLVYSGSTTKDEGQPWKMKRRLLSNFIYILSVSHEDQLSWKATHQNVYVLHLPLLRAFALAFHGNDSLFQKVQDKILNNSS